MSDRMKRRQKEGKRIYILLRNGSIIVATIFGLYWITSWLFATFIVANSPTGIW